MKVRVQKRFTKEEKGVCLNFKSHWFYVWSMMSVRVTVLIHKATIWYLMTSLNQIRSFLIHKATIQYLMTSLNPIQCKFDSYGKVLILNNITVSDAIRLWFIRKQLNIWQHHWITYDTILIHKATIQYFCQHHWIWFSAILIHNPIFDTTESDSNFIPSAKFKKKQYLLEIFNIVV